MIHQLDYNGLDKVDKAVKRLQLYEPPEGYCLCFSGGKDSVVIKALADMAGVKYDAHYNVTSVDPPELVKFVKEHHKDVIFEHMYNKKNERITMWTLIANTKCPPTRHMRYCCKYLKETGGKGRLKVTGVRWAESAMRKASHGEVSIRGAWKKTTVQEIAEREYSDIAYKITSQGGVALPLDNRENAKMVETCYRTHDITVNPIVDWTDAEVWEFIHEYNVPYCELYEKGWTRLGCIGCPMATRKERERHFANYPKYRNLYLLAFEKMLKNKWSDGEPKKLGGTPEEVMEWWLSDRTQAEREVTEIMRLIDE